MEEEKGCRKARTNDRGPEAGKPREAGSFGSDRCPSERLHGTDAWQGYRVT